LFISVALSMLIFFPMSHTGCRSACSGVTVFRDSSGVVRNGPPDAVRMIRATPSVDPPRRHWCTAECSLSTGRRLPPESRTTSWRSAPAMTRLSLLARATHFPAFRA